MIKPNFKMYAVQSRDGKWLRSKGYGGYGNSWVDTIDKAKIWTKEGPAKAQITWWAKNYPDHGIPNLVELDIISGKITDQTDRVMPILKKATQIKLARKIGRKVRILTDYYCTNWPCGKGNEMILNLKHKISPGDIGTILSEWDRGNNIKGVFNIWVNDQEVFALKEGIDFEYI